MTRFRLLSLRTLLISGPVIILETIVIGSVSLFVSLFDTKGRAQHKIARLWSRIVLWASGVKMHVEGLEKLSSHASYVLVANHLSYMDTPVVLAYIPLQFRFLAKKALFAVPFLGLHLRRAGHLPVVRENPRASVKSLIEGARLIRDRKISVLFFSEGGRSQGELQEFKEGAAYLAVKAGVPVVPVGITGTHEVLPKGSIQPRSGHVRLRIGDPIPTAGLGIQNRAELTRRLHEKVAELVGEQPIALWRLKRSRES